MLQRFLAAVANVRANLARAWREAGEPPAPVVSEALPIRRSPYGATTLAPACRWLLRRCYRTRVLACRRLHHGRFRDSPMCRKPSARVVVGSWMNWICLPIIPHCVTSACHDRRFGQDGFCARYRVACDRRRGPRII